MRKFSKREFPHSTIGAFIMTTTIRHIILASILLLVFCSGMIFAQSPIKIPITVTDSATGASRVLWLGWHSSGTYCRELTTLGFAPCDSILETEQPPFPPEGAFEARFVDSRSGSGACLGDGMAPENIHGLTLNPLNLRDTFKIKLQPGGFGYPITFSWSSAISQHVDSMKLKWTNGSDGNPKPQTANGLTQNSIRIYRTGEDQITPSTGFTAVTIIFYGVKGTQTPPDPPTMLTPTTGAIDQPIPIRLTWASTPTALLYGLEGAMDPSFSKATLAFTDTVASLYDTIRAEKVIDGHLRGLNGGVKYYWRVRSFGPFLWGCFPSTPFSFITSLTTPPTMSSPASGETNVSVSPKLKVRKMPGGISYQFVLSKNAGFTQIIKDTTTADTSLQVGPLDNCTQYYWKAKYSTEYATGPFSTPINFYVVDVPPIEPTLTGPADGSVQTTDRPTFTWTSTDVCTRKYLFELSYDSLFGKKIDSSIVTQTSYQVQPIEGEETYYWRVAALNSLNQISAFTTRRMFTTATFTPGPPQLLEPINNGLVNVDSQNFVWRKPKNKPTSYALTYDTAANFSHPVTQSGLTDTSLMINGLSYCTRYFWKVTATNGGNPSSSTSPVFVFDVRRNIPDAPILLRPALGDTGISEDTLLQWRGNACTQKFLLQVSLHSDFSSLLVNDSVSGLFKKITMDNADTIYYWRVQGINELGGSVFSTSYYRTAKKTTPKAPRLSSPHLATLGVGRTPTMCWDSSRSADTYRLQVAVDSNFNTLVFNDSTIQTLCKQIGPLLYSRTYYWRVNAKNDIGTSLYSERWWFNTLFPPDSTELISPPNNSTGVSVSPEFQWSIPNRADVYQLQVARDPGFNVIIYNDSTLQNQSWRVYNLLARTTYYWRVRSHNAAGNGVWSSTYNFKTTVVGVSNWTLPITVGESGFGQDSIYFGIHPDATYGIDPSLGEFQLPPPMVGQFDARFIDIPTRPGKLGEGLRVNVLPFDTYTQVDSFRFSFQLGTGVYPVHISWDPTFVRGICDSMVMLDMFDGLGLRERMDLVSSASVTNLSTTSLLIVVYGAYPVPTDVKPQKEVPQGFTLSQNYPNPFNPETRIEFSNEKESMVSIAVYNVLGKEITRLINSEMSPGFHSVVWNGQNQEGVTVPSGIYYLRMIATQSNSQSTPFVASQKMLFMK